VWFVREVHFLNNENWTECYIVMQMKCASLLSEYTDSTLYMDTIVGLRGMVVSRV
jgi:hypothetical protein